MRNLAPPPGKATTYLIILLFCFALPQLKAQQWTAFNAMDATEPVCTVCSSTNDSVVFSVTIPGMHSETLDSLQRIWIEGHNKMDSVGYPELPVLSYLIAIPDCDSVALTFTPKDSLIINNWNIYPAPEMVVDTTAQGYEYLAEEFTYDTSFYRTNTLFPSINAELVDRGAFRDQHCIRATFYPVHFNPVENQLKIYNELTAKLSFTNARGSVNEDVGIFNEIAGNAMINYESNGKNASINTAINNDTIGSWQWVDTFPNGHLNEPCDYLLITHEDFYDDTASRNAINKLAQQRAYFNGFDVVMVKTEDIYDDFSGISQDSSVRIRELLINIFEDDTAHHTYDGKLGYLCLFGDTFFDDNSVCVPSNRWNGNYENNGGEDSYFARLTYNTSLNFDNYPDIFAARLSVDSRTQVANIVNKIIDFKPFENTYKNQFLQYVGNDQDHYDSYNKNFEKVHEILPGDSIFIISKDDYDNLYYYNGWTYKKPYTLNTLLGVWGEGISIFNYFGHGGPNGLVSNDFEYEDLTGSQDSILPFGIITACYTGKFHCVDECFTEKMQNQSRYRGMIGVIGARIISSGDMLGYNTYNSLVYNSPIIGSAFFESQIRGHYYLTTYNLFGDPALNLFYEGIDTLKPDIIINEFTSQKKNNKPSDTIKLNVIISNIIGLDICDTIISSFYIKHIDSSSYRYISSVITDSLSAFSFKSLYFTIPPNYLEESHYIVKALIDSANRIDELSELNNAQEIEFSVINLDEICIGNLINTSIVPISYNLRDTSGLNQVVAGSKVFSHSGNLLVNHDKLTNNYSGIGVSEKDQLLFCNASNSNHTNNNIVISFTLDSLWYIKPDEKELYGPSSVGPVDNTSEDYIFFNEINYADSNWYYSLNCLDYKCNKIWMLEDFSKVLDNSPEPEQARMFPPVCFFDINDLKHKVISVSEDGKIYIIEVNQSGVPFVSESDTIRGCVNILSPPIIADMKYNGNIQLAFRFLDIKDDYALALLDLNTSQYDTVHLANSHTKGPWFYDLNNKGSLEIVTSALWTGFSFYDDQLIDSHISDTLLNKLAGFCDADNDNIPEIIYEINEGTYSFLKSIDYLDSTSFKIPLSETNFTYHITDKEHNGKIDILHSRPYFLGNIELLEDSKPWMWQGELGNLRNNCNFMQPAYYKTNDTVYWTDNISIPDTFEIPYGSTVIIKPGTYIYAKEDAEFIVYGKLIAKGTENHTIKFIANIMGADKDHWGGITAKTNGTVDLQYCHIENAEVGLFLYSRSPEDVKNNTFKNNKVGLCTYANSPDIIENYFTGNNIAVACHASSGPKFVGGSFGTIPYYNGLIDNDTAISIYNSLPVVRDGYNDIYNDTLGIYIVFVDDVPRSPLNARNNYYGSTDTSEIIDHFVPEAYFNIYPVLSSAQTNFKNLTTSPAEELLATAWQYFNEEKYYSAAQYFQQLIDNYPATNEALYAINGEFDAYKLGYLGWTGFIDNMEELLLDSIFNTNIEKYAFEYLNTAFRLEGQYNDAIENYQNEISNPQGYYDSLYAVINLSNTILESGGFKSSLLTNEIEERLISSEISHVVRTKELLFSYPSEKRKSLLENQCLKILSIFPVPASESATIEFESCNEGTLMVDVFSAAGVKVFNNQINHGKGYNALKLKYCLPPGVYIMRLLNNESSVSKRIIIK